MSQKNRTSLSNINPETRKGRAPVKFLNEAMAQRKLEMNAIRTMPVLKAKLKTMIEKILKRHRQMSGENCSALFSLDISYGMKVILRSKNQNHIVMVEGWCISNLDLT